MASRNVGAAAHRPAAAVSPANDHTSDVTSEAPAIAGEILLIPVSEIRRGDRLRPIDPVWASALGAIMAREGQQTPVEVCREPGQTGWLLVAGAHRHRGAELAGIELLEAREVSGSAAHRRMREVTENLWRRELDPIDRAAFLAELVTLHKLRAGIDPNKDGRTASANARWQKALAAEADDATATIAVAYGWDAAIGEQVGLSARTVRDQLFLYRRLSPSQVARLREARHPAGNNAAQLRALAKLEPTQQEQVVAELLAQGGPKSVGDALKRLGHRPAAAAPDAKRLSAFLGAFARMSLAERRGALARLAPMLPAGVRLVDGGAA